MAQVERPSSVPAPLEWEYAPAPEARDIVQIRERYGLFVGGTEVEPLTGVVSLDLALHRGAAVRGRARG